MNSFISDEAKRIAEQRQSILEKTPYYPDVLEEFEPNNNLYSISTIVRVFDHATDRWFAVHVMDTHHVSIETIHQLHKAKERFHKEAYIAVITFRLNETTKLHVPIDKLQISEEERLKKQYEKG